MGIYRDFSEYCNFTGIYREVGTLCNSVKTKVRKQFLKLINMHFPEGSKLHKIFNKNTVKITYSCSTNLKSIIQAHNKKVLSKQSLTAKLYNCRKTPQCPFNGQCLQKGIHKATISHQNVTKKYIGSTGVSFKSEE